MPSPLRFPVSARHRRLLSLRWQRRALFVLGGIAVGLAAVGLALAADGAGTLFQAVLAWQPLAAILLTPAGFAASSWLARRYFPNSGGSGIPQAIAARQLHGTAARARLLSMRTALGTMTLLLLQTPMATHYRDLFVSARTLTSAASRLRRKRSGAPNWSWTTSLTGPSLSRRLATPACLTWCHRTARKSCT